MKQQTKATLVIIGCICMLQSCAFRPFTTMTTNFSGVHSRIVGDSDSWTGALGFQGGVEAHIPFNSTIPLTAWAGFNVSMQGAGWVEDWGEGPVEGTTRLWYLNFPLTSRYQFGKNLYGEFGIQPGVLLSAKDNYDGESYDYSDNIKTFDLGIPLGLGFNFPNNFGVGLRVTPGVLNINAGEYSDYKDRNFVIALRGTYTFKGKGK
jgi:hypothetical protein